MARDALIEAQVCKFDGERKDIDPAALTLVLRMQGGPFFKAVATGNVLARRYPAVHGGDRQNILVTSVPNDQLAGMIRAIMASDRVLIEVRLEDGKTVPPLFEGAIFAGEASAGSIMLLLNFEVLHAIPVL